MLHKSLVFHYKYLLFNPFTISCRQGRLFNRILIFVKRLPILFVGNVGYTIINIKQIIGGSPAYGILEYSFVYLIDETE